MGPISLIKLEIIYEPKLENLNFIRFLCIWSLSIYSIFLQKKKFNLLHLDASMFDTWQTNNEGLRLKN
jgi:hypothetical protein